MANISRVRVCHSCNTDLTATPIQANSDGQEICPYCNKTLKTLAHKNFDSPGYLMHQLKILQEDGGNDKLKPGDKHYLNRAVRLDDELTQWARACPDADRVEAMGDAFRLLQEVMHSGASRDTIQYMTTTGKMIGKLAEAIEQYFKTGGYHHDRKIRFLPPDPADVQSNQAAASASWDTGR